jgi:hypothetical protein
MARRRPGRPWRAGEPADHRVNFRLTAREFREVEEIAHANGRTVNDLARLLVLANVACFTELTPTDDDLLLDELPAPKRRARVIR